LIFEIERDLTAAPLKIDVLIIKKRKNVAIKKNIAEIFRHYNIVEYKSPDDYISLNVAKVRQSELRRRDSASIVASPQRNSG
jgi:hypothetical protein